MTLTCKIYSLLRNKSVFLVDFCMGKRLNQPRVLNIGSTKSDDIPNHK